MTNKFTLKDIIKLDTAFGPIRTIEMEDAYIVSRVTDWGDSGWPRYERYAVCHTVIDYKNGGGLRLDSFEVRADHLNGKRPTFARVGELLSREARDVANHRALEYGL